MWEALEPAVLELTSAIIAAAIAVAAFYLRRWTGIQVEAKHREALHEALMSGAMAAVRHGPKEGFATLEAQAISHARASVPDAVRYLVPGETVLDTIAERYVREAMERGFAAIGAEPK